MQPPSMASTEFLRRLGWYRDVVTPAIASATAGKEPGRHLYDLLSAHLSRAGKGMRPALCLATTGAFGGDIEKAIPTAAALELLHNAFLIHDDIEDGSDSRRGHPTMHVEHGTPLAVNAGDAMQALSFRLLRNNPRLFGMDLAEQIADEFDHMLVQSLEGQAIELGWIHDNNCVTSQDDYLRMVLKKTCWYSFIHPCRIGALIARGHDRSLDRFNNFGLFLGCAFQIQDDVLNLIGDESKYGKEIGGDLWEGKRTLILAHLFREVRGADAERLTSVLAKTRAQRSPTEVAWIYDLLRRHGSIEVARRAAHEFTEAARAEFDAAYADAVPGEDLEFLRQFVAYTATRDV